MRTGLGIAFLCGALALSGCASFPELDATISPEARRADYPTLVPADTILAQQSYTRISADTGTNLQARVARLRQRAAILRTIVVLDDATRLRIAGRLRRLGG